MNNKITIKHDCQNSVEIKMEHIIKQIAIKNSTFCICICILYLYIFFICILKTERKWRAVKILGGQLGWQWKDCRAFYQIQLFDSDVGARWLCWYSFPIIQEFWMHNFSYIADVKSDLIIWQWYWLVQFC